MSLPFKSLLRTEYYSYDERDLIGTVGGYLGRFSY